MLEYDGLARFAARSYGAPLNCEGERTTEFDGAWFGNVRLTFESDVTLEVSTMPPESSVVILSSPTGFADDERIRDALVDYGTERGLAVDWSAPEITSNDDDVVHTYWDPDPGLNASASLVYSRGVLVAVRAGMAL